MTHHHAKPHRHPRRTAYHILGGEGHKDAWVKVVDYALIALVVLNVLAVILESVNQFSIAHGPLFHSFDVVSVVIFSAEYLLRVWTAVEHDDPRYRHPLWGRLRYMVSPLAIIDLLAILPFYLGMLVQIDLRAMRVLWLLRVLKLTRYSSAMAIMVAVWRQEGRAIGAAMFILLIILIFTASLMYLFEHRVQPEVFSDIPSAMWWAVVTLTTLGYGDMTPVTPAGRLLGACTAVLGVGMIALPAGVLASGFSEQLRLRREQYVDKVEQTLQDGRITRRERRLLEDTREALGLSQEEAARLLHHAVKGGGYTTCPHCGEPLPAHGPDQDHKGIQSFTPIL